MRSTSPWSIWFAGLCWTGKSSIPNTKTLAVSFLIFLVFVVRGIWNTVAVGIASPFVHSLLAVFNIILLVFCRAPQTLPDWGSTEWLCTFFAYYLFELFGIDEFVHCTAWSMIEIESARPVAIAQDFVTVAACAHSAYFLIDWHTIQATCQVDSFLSMADRALAREFEEDVGCLKSVVDAAQKLAGFLPEEAHDTRAVQERLRALERAVNRFEEQGHSIHPEVLARFAEARNMLEEDWNGQTFMERYACCSHRNLGENARATCLNFAICLPLPLVGWFAGQLAGNLATCLACGGSFCFAATQTRLEWRKLQRNLRKIVHSLNVGNQLLLIEALQRPVPRLSPTDKFDCRRSNALPEHASPTESFDCRKSDALPEHASPTGKIDCRKSDTIPEHASSASPSDGGCLVAWMQVHRFSEVKFLSIAGDQGEKGRLEQRAWHAVSPLSAVPCLWFLLVCWCPCFDVRSRRQQKGRLLEGVEGGGCGLIRSVPVKLSKVVAIHRPLFDSKRRFWASFSFQYFRVREDGYFFFCGSFFFGSWFYAFLLLCFSAVLLLCFSAFLFLCFSAFPASLLVYFSASLLYLLLFFSASLLSLLLCFCAFLLLLFYFFFSSVMCFCCSTSCSSASLLPVFTASLFFFLSFALFSPVCILNETLQTLGETQRNPKEILIRSPDKKPLHETLNEP